MLLGVGKTAVLAKNLPTADFGILAIVVNFYGFFGSILTLRVGDLVYKYFPLLSSQRDPVALRGVLLLTLCLCALSGVGMFSFAVLASPALGLRLYHNDEVGRLLLIYAPTVAFSSFQGFCIPVLRLHNRYTYAVLPRVLENFLVLVGSLVYFRSSSRSDLSQLVAIMALANSAAMGVPLLLAIRETKEILRGQDSTLRDAAEQLKRIRRDLSSTFLQISVTKYLRLIFSPGDTFLMKIFSSPQHVAYYTFARTLMTPFSAAEGAAAAALFPEITSMWARSDRGGVRKLLMRYVSSTAVGSALTLLLLYLGAQPLVLLLAKADYVEAIPILWLFALSAAVSLSAAGFYPVALCAQRIHWLNLANVLNCLMLALFLAVERHQLTGVAMAGIQLVAIVLRRGIANALVVRSALRPVDPPS